MYLSIKHSVRVSGSGNLFHDKGRFKDHYLPVLCCLIPVGEKGELTK